MNKWRWSVEALVVVVTQSSLAFMSDLKITKCSDGSIELLLVEDWPDLELLLTHLADQDLDQILFQQQQLLNQ